MPVTVEIILTEIYLLLFESNRIKSHTIESITYIMSNKKKFIKQHLIEAQSKHIFIVINHFSYLPTYTNTDDHINKCKQMIR